MINKLLAIDTSVQVNPPAGSIGATAQGFTLGGILGAVVNLVMIAAALIFFFMLVIGGIRWITSGGDKGQTEAARGQITAALVGLVIVFAAWAIAKLVGNFLGFDIFSLTIPGIPSTVVTTTV